MMIRHPVSYLYTAIRPTYAMPEQLSAEPRDVPNVHYAVCSGSGECAEPLHRVVPNKLHTVGDRAHLQQRRRRRRSLDALLLDKINEPSLDIASHPVLTAIVQLITTERAGVS